MKLIIEIPDPDPAPKSGSTTTSAPAKANSPVETTRPTPVTSRASEEARPKQSDEKPSPRLAAASNSRNFANQGGVTVVHDPDKDKPGVFKFSYTEEKR